MHIKNHAINDSRKLYNATYRVSAMSMASITTVVAILHWILGTAIERRQDSVEIWAALIMIEVDQAEIEHEEVIEEKEAKKARSKCNKVCTA
ncbi:hypothetical protein TWF506_001894 [Arthrobotrys conoides]|uniref:Uncharacterized protein n=1 Tax=Arthrobotrys conoides TaxID=74498 RepID=A0AAN8RRN2_9PEZI